MKNRPTILEETQYIQPFFKGATYGVEIIKNFNEINIAWNRYDDVFDIIDSNTNVSILSRISTPDMLKYVNKIIIKEFCKY